MTDDISAKRRQAFETALVELKDRIGSLNAWCTRSGAKYSTVHSFLRGKTKLMSDRTYEKLADEAGVTVAYLKGDPEERGIDERRRQFLELFDLLTPSEQLVEAQALLARVQLSEKKQPHEGD